MSRRRKRGGSVVTRRQSQKRAPSRGASAKRAQVQATRGPVAEHRAKAPRALRCVVITASDTRTAASDESGSILAEGLRRSGHAVIDRRIVSDDPTSLRAALVTALERDVDAILITGGTGVSPRDRAPEAVSAVCERLLPGFGEAFRMLSFLEIGSAAFLSRALAGVVGRCVIFALPGSPSACRLALERLVLPELPHVVGQLVRR